MKFTCTQENLSRGLLLVGRVAGKNAALPILHNVLIQAESGAVKLSTTNLELGLTTTIRAKVEVPGNYTVQARLLTDFVGLLGNNQCQAELTDQGLLITSGQTKTTLKGIPAEEFPVLPTIDPTTTIDIDGRVIQNLLEGVVFAVANDESRPEISGILLSFSESSIVATATDSYRLAERRAPLPKRLEKNQSIILPARSASELLRALNTSGNIKISLSENQFYCQTNDITLISRTIEGHYPDYQQIIPTTSTTTVKIPKEQFISAVRAASLFCKPGINDITLGVDSTKKTISLSAANTTTGEHQGQIECVITGQPQTIVFNYRYLLEGVQSFTDEEITLELQDSQAPGVIRPTTKTENLYLLMPIRQ